MSATEEASTDFITHPLPRDVQLDIWAFDPQLETHFKTVEKPSFRYREDEKLSGGHLFTIHDFHDSAKGAVFIFMIQPGVQYSYSGCSIHIHDSARGAVFLLMIQLGLQYSYCTHCILFRPYYPCGSPEIAGGEETKRLVQLHLMHHSERNASTSEHRIGSQP